ncbi:CaiB/BaiF CoA-transferase family protein [Sphingobium sp. EM0848]|uniref:CaiB/BaiF CoA transferase family protein n=1 Tax=Sphingobium sp. EM0848 TaxID=2743473 RepID=UPI00159C8F2D|nr:CaiB/BaiF CoA-transferase family protein [Sphingobium sp. EM0848]
MGALDGILVVALEQAVAAPLCSQRLADAGARVIKVERAEGDFARGYDRAVHGESSYFVWLNHGKESVVLDIKRESDAALLDKMIAQADVFVQNLAPGAAERAGFGSATLRARHPRLITCDISGYGEDGPLRDRKAYDLLIQCETGLAAITGTPDAPGRAGVSVADIACGMNAHAAILEALVERAYTGEGRAIAVSLFDSLAEWMAVPLLHHDYAGRAPGRVGLSHPSIAPYGAVSCRDGRPVVISIQSEREWRIFCRDVIERPELANMPDYSDNSRRVANRVALDAIVADIFATLDPDELIERLESAAIAFGSVNEVANLSRHPALRRQQIETPSGPAEIPASPMRWTGQGLRNGTVPGIGSHTDAINKEFA